MTSVTLNNKRNWEWAFVCAGCGLLASSERSDAITCSPACRVKAHRKGSIKLLTDLANMLALTDNRTGKPKIAPIKQCAAIELLCPELYEQMGAGSLTIYQAMPETYRAFVKLLMQAVREE